MNKKYFDKNGMNFCISVRRRLPASGVRFNTLACSVLGEMFLLVLTGLLATVCSQTANSIGEDDQDDNQSKIYTTSWAVEIIEGGEKMANTIAGRYEFINRGKLPIGDERDIFHFELSEKDSSKVRTDVPFTFKTVYLLSEPNIGFVEQQVIRSRILKSYTVPTDPLFHNQWQLLNTGQYGAQYIGNDLNVEPAWMQGVTGCNVTTVVVDDGMNIKHSDLWDNFSPEVSYDFIEDDHNPSSDVRHHGTSCGGIIGAVRNDVCGVGIAYDVNLGGIALVGAGTDMNEARSLLFENDIVDIYSNSWGPSDSGSTVEGPGELTRLALQSGVNQGRDGKGSIYVWANGNGGREDDDCAADGYTQSIYTISVGAIGVDGNPSPFDEQCSAKMVTAYVTDHNGDPTVSTTAEGGGCTSYFGGTSAATSIISGIISLVLEANSTLTWRDVQYLIVYTSNPLLTNTTNSIYNGAGLLVSRQFGFGVIDAEAMVTRARHWINVPPQLEENLFLVTSIMTTNYSGSIQYLEHVVVTMTVTTTIGSRGDIRIELTSPSGTLSTLLSHRDNDGSGGGYIDWPFMSVMFWGEDPTGEWSLSVITRSTTEAIVSDVEFQFYGVSSIPESVANIPDECHSDCRRGCAQEGSEFCDACVNLRNAYTLECIDTCPLEYTEHNGYCYDSTLPTRVCNSPLKNKIVSCIDTGFDGCCTGNDCKLSSYISCYCDSICYSYGDCCDDISLTGCQPNITRTVGTVLPYIILGVTDDVTTQSVPRRRDGLSPLISIQFPIGDELESVVGVGTNGYFAFEQYLEFMPFIFDGSRNLSLVAPFFTDIDISRDIGQVSYEIHTDSSSTGILSQVNSLINEHKQTQFNGQWLLVATWEDVPAYGNYSITNTFQGMIVTDFSRSFAVFTYYCGDLSYSNGATIGFTTTDGLFANHPATIRGRAEYIACLNYPVSPWVNVIYEITKPRPIIGFNSVFYSVDENDGVIEVCVELLSQGMITEQVDVKLNTADGTASVPTDYTALIDGVLVFPAGSVMGDTVCVEILIINDFVLELYEENFFVNITSNDANISPGLESATILIQDSDQVVLVFDKLNYTVTESSGELEICVVTNRIVLTQPLTLSVVISSVRANVRLPLTLKPSSNRTCLIIPLSDDDIVESHEHFNLGITIDTPLPGVSVGNVTSTITIYDDDEPVIGLKTVNFSVDEEIDESIEVCVELISRGMINDHIEVILNTADGTASASIDYTSLSDEVLVFPTGSVIGDSVCVAISIINDNIPEMNKENFFVIIKSDDANISPGLGSATILIQDSDQDINECVTPDQECEQSCINNPGSYSCGCWDGYRLDSNGKTCSIDCGSELSSTSGSFQTPGWPDHYPQVDFICEWTISVPNASAIRFEVDSSAYGINGRPPCPRDHIEFFDGLESDSQSLGRFCKLKVPEPITVTTGAARIVFEGQRNPYRPVSRKGVKVDYTVTVEP